MAGPTGPDEVFARLQKACAKGLPPVVVVTGANDWYREQAVDWLLSRLPADAELRRLDAVEVRAGGGGGGDDDEDTEDAAAEADAAAEPDSPTDCPELLELRGGGLFAKQAFLCVRRGKNWWVRNAEFVANAVPRFGKGCSLILEAVKLDRRRKAAAALHKSLVEGGALFEFRELYETPFERGSSPLDGELVKWVVGRAAQAGVPLAPEAAWLLVGQVGKALPELLAEIERLRVRIQPPPARPLRPEDLRGLLTCSFESNPFEFAEAVLAHDEAAAWRSLRAMFDRGVRNKSGKRDTGGVFPFVGSWLWQTLAKAYEGRQLLESGVPLRDIPNRLGSGGRFADRLAGQVQRNSLAQLRRGMLALHDATRQQRLTGEEPDVLLGRFLSQWFGRQPVTLGEDLDL